MKKTLSLLATLLIIVSITPSVQAAYLSLGNWTLNLNAILDSYTDADGNIVDSSAYNSALDGQITQISEILYNGIAYTQTDDSNGNYSVDNGEIGSTQGLLSSIAYGDSSGTQQFWKDADTFFALTMDFSANAVGTATGWSHLAAGTITGSTLDVDGYLDIYLDLNNNAMQTTGGGYTDGILIARFAILGGDGGDLLSTTLDGHDDASFELIWAIDDLLLMADGTDLMDYILDPNNDALLITDSNYDADADHNGALDSNLGTNVWTTVGTQYPTNFITKEDGSASLIASSVPEPATMIFVGLGLLGIAGIGRKKISA